MIVNIIRGITMGISTVAVEKKLRRNSLDIATDKRENSSQVRHMLLYIQPFLFITGVLHWSPSYERGNVRECLNDPISTWSLQDDSV